MITFYCLVWAITALNLMRCLAQLAPSEATWELLWLLARAGSRGRAQPAWPLSSGACSPATQAGGQAVRGAATPSPHHAVRPLPEGMLMVEVAVLAFPAQGLSTTAQHALARTLALSGGVAAAEAALKAVLIYALHIPLLLDGCGGAHPARGWAGRGRRCLAPLVAVVPRPPSPAPPLAAARSSTLADPRGDERWPKWAFWAARASASAAAYALVARLPSTRWRDALPAKPEIYRYAAVMAGAYALKAAGAVLIPAGAPGAGYCVFALGALAYDAGFAPLVFAAFLSGFFGGGGLLGAAPSELDADLLLYSEMREAEFV
jgi:hypothetical protein